jgi:type VI secretion system protein ImpH
MTLPSDLQADLERRLQLLTRTPFTQWLRCIQVESGQRIGHDPSLEGQPVRLVCDTDPSFPASELSGWRPAGSSGTRPELAVTFFGLFGPSGILPDHYHQLLLERVRDKDFSLREFLNIFNHRFLCLFYQAWEKHAFAISMETAAAAKAAATPTEALSALVGLRLAAAKQRSSVGDDTFLYYSSLVSTCRPSQEDLRGCLQDYTGLATDIEPLVGQWLRLAPEDQSRIGSFALGTQGGNRLGIDTLAGQRVWDIENRFRIRFGPVDWTTFEGLLPTGPILRRIAEWTRQIVGPQWDCDCQILIQADQVRGAQLGSDGPALLGWNTWLGDWQSPRSADQAIFALEHP